MSHLVPLDRSALVLGLLPVDAAILIAAVVAAMLVLIVGFFLAVAFARWVPRLGDEFGPTGEQLAIESRDSTDSEAGSESTSTATATQESDVNTTDSGTESVEGS